MKTFEASGIQLCNEDRRHVLSAYVHRFTKNHVPGWSKNPDGTACPVQFASDDEWLRNTKFAVKRNGRLDKRVKSCTSSQTWPDNPELRKA